MYGLSLGRFWRLMPVLYSSLHKDSDFKVTSMFRTGCPDAIDWGPGLHVAQHGPQLRVGCLVKLKASKFRV